MSDNNRLPIVVDLQEQPRKRASCCFQFYALLMVLGLCGSSVAYSSQARWDDPFFAIVFWSCLTGSTMVALELVSTLIEHCSPKYKYRLGLIPPTSGILACALTYFYFPNYYSVACGVGSIYHLILLFCESQFSIRSGLLREYSE